MLNVGIPGNNVLKIYIYKPLSFAACIIEMQVRLILINKTPAKAFTPPTKTKMGTRPGRAVTREFIGGEVYSLISVLPNKFLFKSISIRVPSKAF